MVPNHSSSQSHRISILTPSFNQAQYIEQNIRSVMEQGYPDFEHIIVDDGSTDETVSILRRYPHLKWITQPNRGQANALNRALSMSTGDIIGWVNSDDYLEPGVFPHIARGFADHSVQWIVGGLTVVMEPSGQRIPRTSPVPTYRNLVWDPDIIRQPATFFRRSAIVQAGGWDEDLYMVMDLDLWLRVARKNPPVVVKRKYACFRRHTAQKSGPRNAERQRLEISRVLSRHQAPLGARLTVSIRKRYYIFRSTVRRFLECASLLRYRSEPGLRSSNP
ncbi:MAG TPA: glycosyltransferase family 2 protein [Bryobacteraceae bacterium]|nr:glycosyltransferase family 2 protein [Bryobacteraceae bacterium]